MSAKHLSVKDLSEELGVSYDHAKNLILKGFIPAVDTGTGERSFWRVSRADLDKYLTDRKADTAHRIERAS